MDRTAFLLTSKDCLMALVSAHFAVCDYKQPSQLIEGSEDAAATYHASAGRHRDVAARTAPD